MPSKYFIDSGGSVDYEVDYEEEAKQLIMGSKDTKTRKQDFIDIIFGEGKSEKDKIRAYNLANQDLHQHPFSTEQYDFIVFGMSMGASKIKKTFTLRSPFIIFNKTTRIYMLKIIKYQSSEAKVLQIAPGEGYPLSQQELRCKILLSTYDDYYQAQEHPDSPTLRPEEIWSSHFKVSTLFQKHDIAKKKFFLYHARQFSMVFVQPGQFFPAWDICIKVPLIIRNTLPFDLQIRTYHVKKYILPRSMLLSSQTKKDIVPEATPTEYVIPKQGMLPFHNFNLEGEVRFELNIDIPTEDQGPLLRWCQFVLVRDEYKANEKTIVLEDAATGQQMELSAKIKSTEHTDLEITFYCQNCMVNNTDQRLVFWGAESKKRIAGQSSCDNSIVLLSGKSSKLMASISEEGPLPVQVSTKNASSAFPVHIVGISNQILITKSKAAHHELLLNTTWSLASPTDSHYSKITTINPKYVVCNQTSKLLLVAQAGFQDKHVEVLPHEGRLPLYWVDPKAPRRLQFKLAEPDTDGGFDDRLYEWAQPIKLQKIGRVSIRCRKKQDVIDGEHVVVIKKVSKETQTMYLIFQIETEASPTYRIENHSEAVWMTYYQQGVGSGSSREILAPGCRSIYSWTDPEKSKTKQVLCCHLELKDAEDDQLKILQKLEIELDNAEYSKTFIGRFVDDDLRNLQISAQQSKARRPTQARIRKALQGLGASQIEEQQYSERIVKIEVVAEGCTKTLRLTERENEHAPAAGGAAEETAEPGEEGNTTDRAKQVVLKQKVLSKKARPESRLEQISEVEVLTEVEEQPQRESKVQLDIRKVYLSFIARSDKKVRREFMLGYLESIEFLAVVVDEDQEVQLRVGYFQVDNSITSESRQLFPFVLYPKEVRSRAQLRESGAGNQRPSKPFFNAHLRLKQSSSDTMLIDRIEFLLQSAVLQMDDELIGWVIKFAECLSSNLRANLSGVHQIFERDAGLANPALPDGRMSLLSRPDMEATGFAFRDPQRPEDDGGLAVEAGVPDFFTTLEQRARLGGQERRHYAEQVSLRPAKKHGVHFWYAAFAREPGELPVFAQLSPDSWLHYDIEARASPVFIKELVMSPIDFEISFRTRGKTENEILVDDAGLMRGLKQLGLSLSNVDKAPFRLNSLVITNVYGTPEEIHAVLYAHYRHRLMKNVLGLFLSTAALGNMNLLAQDIGTGVKDFFYRPIEGFVDGPIEGGKGLVIGTASLLGNTAKGAFGSMSRILNTVSKSLLFLAADPDYMDRREQAVLERPENVLQGLRAGLKSTASGVASGVAGIYLQPARGARQSGVRGFVKGGVKGLGGAVVKSFSGGLDLLMKTSEGAHNMVRLGGRRRRPALQDAAAGSDEEEEEKQTGANVQTPLAPPPPVTRIQKPRPQTPSQLQDELERGERKEAK